MASLVSEIWLLFVCLQKQPKLPFGPWTIVHGGQKIELAQKFMQVEADVIHVKCMETNFGGHGFYGFRDFATFCLSSDLAKKSV